MKDFLSGLSYNFTGLKYFLSHKNLWKYAIIPLVINFLLLILLVSLYVSFFDNIFLYISKPLAGIDITNPQGALWHVLDGLLWVVRGLFTLFIFLVALVLIFVSVFFLGSVINSPFYESLSEHVQIMAGRLPPQPFRWNFFLAAIIHSLKLEGLKFLLFILVSGVLFFLGWIPVVGIIFSVLGFFFTAWLFAFGICAYPMILKRLPLSEIFSWGLKRKSLLIGFGLPSVIPFVGLLIANFQVVGGTLLYLEQTK